MHCKLFLFQCPEQDSNLHTLASTSPSSWRVYQFHHLGNISFENVVLLTSGLFLSGGKYIKKSTFDTTDVDFFIRAKSYLILIWPAVVIFSQYLHLSDIGSVETTLKQVVTCSLFVMHFGLKHFTIPVIASGISTTRFSTTS